MYCLGCESEIEEVGSCAFCENHGGKVDRGVMSSFGGPIQDDEYRSILRDENTIVRMHSVSVVSDVPHKRSKVSCKKVNYMCYFCRDPIRDGSAYRINLGNGLFSHHTHCSVSCLYGTAFSQPDRFSMTSITAFYGVPPRLEYVPVVGRESLVVYGGGMTIEKWKPIKIEEQPVEKVFESFTKCC